MIKKKCALLAVAALLASVLSACGQDVDSLREIKAANYVTLGEYKGIEVTVTDPAVLAEANMEADLEQLAAMNTIAVEVTDRTEVQKGDTVNIDYTGYQDGVAFENGAAEGDSLTIGSGRFIPGFEDGLIGKNVGETVMLNLTFPADYDNAQLAGADVTFEVKINSISILEPQGLTLDFIQQVTNVEYNTIEEFREAIYDEYYEEAVASNQTEIRTNVVNAVMDNCIFEEPPEGIVIRYRNILIADITAELATININLDTYMRTYFGMDQDAYMEMFRQRALTTANQNIMFQAIADAENMSMTDKEFRQEMEEYALANGFESVETFKEEIGEEIFYEFLLTEDVIEFLADNAVVHTEN